MFNDLKILLKVIKKNKYKNYKKSYTASLFKKGSNGCIKKFQEESGELVDAFKKNNKKNIIHETADMLYHLLVLLELKKIKIFDIMLEIRERRKISGIVEKKNRRKNVRSK
jgi:phosphoribosyl-ATP pyrophosphohydrolase